MRRALVALVFASSCVQVFADGLVRDGLGARVAGRGGTNLAWADSGTILHDNPAGAVNLEGCSLVECGYDLLWAHVDYSDPGTDADWRQGLVPLGNMSLLKKLDDNVTVGFGVFSTGGFATRYKMDGPPSFPGERTYKSFGALVRLLPGVSLKMTDRWSVGATLGVGASHIELEGPYTLQSGPLRGTPMIMDTQATGAALSWSLGSQYQLTPQTTIGVAYQSETRSHISGKSSAIIPNVGESTYDLDMDIVWPRSIGLGVRHEFCECRIGSVDLIYYNWQKAFDEIGLFMTNPTNPVFAGFGPIEEQKPLHWRDTLSVRVGYEHVLANSNRLRYGYVYHRNPIPSSTLTPYIAPTIEHTVSIGYGTKISNWEVDFGYQFMFGDNVSVNTEWIGGDFDNSNVDSRAHFFYMSFMRFR